MYSWFPKPTILARKRVTGLRSHEMSVDPAIIAAAIPLLGGVAISNTHTMIMMNLRRKTSGHKMTMVTPATHLLESTVTIVVEVLVDTPLPGTLMNLVLRDHLAQQRTHPSDMTLVLCPLLQQREETLALRATTPLITPVTLLGTTMAHVQGSSLPTTKVLLAGSNKTFKATFHPLDRWVQLAQGKGLQLDPPTQVGSLGPSSKLRPSRASEHSYNSRHRHQQLGLDNRHLQQVLCSHSHHKLSSFRRSLARQVLQQGRQLQECKQRLPQ